MLDFGFKHTTLTMPELVLLSYCKVKDNGVDTSGLGNSFTNVSGSWALGTFVGTMPNSAAIKTALGHVNGVADWAYGADDLPIAGLTQAVITANNNSFNFLVSSKGIAIYGSPDTLATATQVRADRAMKLLPYNQPTAFFNGVDSSVSTRTTDGNGVYRSTADTATSSFTGGPQWVADNLGVLRLSPTDSMARQGMRVLATLADYAAAGVAPVYGGELVTNGTFDTDTNGWLAVGSGDITFSSVAGKLSIVRGAGGVTGAPYIPFVCSAGKIYAITMDRGPVAAHCIIGGSPGGANYIFNGVGVATDTFEGLNPIMYLTIWNFAASTTITIDNISIRELIPTYYDTALDGNPIVTSVNQATRTEASPGVYTPSTTLKRYNTANPLTMPGFLCEPARTNKCTCQKANPTGITNVTPSGSGTAGGLTIVSDVAALAAAKLNGVCTSGNVYKLDNSTGVSYAYVLISGSSTTTAHSVSAYVRGSAGEVGLQAEIRATFSASDTYIRRIDGNRTPSSARSTIITVGVGGIIYFILPQLEEGSFCTSPIVGEDTTASATRAATVLAYPTAGKIRSNNMAFKAILIPRATGQSGVFAFGSTTDASNALGIILDPTVITLRKRASGANTDAPVTITHTKDVPIMLVGILSSTYGMVLAAATYSAGWPALSSGSVITTAGAKANAILKATYSNGSDGATTAANQMCGNLPLFETLPIPQGITDPLAWAKKEWGIT